ncbi:CRISPR-associated protein Cas4 [Senegalia massiliensis]|uniref:CRISPR-associated exonuclease Cas4 n=1 Tax=Senegalia massiliensis TaxID=1720316 RepID=A0A845QVR7_9CLOT|nr:CRISPR-associated protein Cas4 [Senegalia massiliensis]NBI06180.1 CRISPR-associated protein Cas4 [Senegalia massiliensis]
MKNVTGVIFYYYFICKRKLWYFSKDLNMEKGNELVEIGKLIDENSYKREKKNILIDENINIDFIKDWKVIHEVKKSRKIEDAAIWQLKYYMYLLKEKGVDIEKGILDYPLLRRRNEIYLTEDDKYTINNIIEKIDKIQNLHVPPAVIDAPICKKCAYYELCYI